MQCDEVKLWWQQVNQPLWLYIYMYLCSSANNTKTYTRTTLWAKALYLIYESIKIIVYNRGETTTSRFNEIFQDFLLVSVLAGARDVFNFLFLLEFGLFLGCLLRCGVVVFFIFIFIWPYSLWVSVCSYVLDICNMLVSLHPSWHIVLD